MVVVEHECLGRGCKECQMQKLGIISKERKKFKNNPTAVKNRSKSQERTLGKSYKTAGFEDASRVPGSGMIAVLPGDVDPGRWFLGEAKETRSGKMIVEPEWYDKIEAQAKQMGRQWWVLHTWTAEDMGRYRKLVTVPEETFFEILRRLNVAETELENLLNASQGMLNDALSGKGMLFPGDTQKDADND